MTKNILIILLGKRKESAVNVQKILTQWGCLIKTRLGIHDGVMENCSESGLIILDLVGENEKKEEFTRKLNLLSGVTAKLVELSIDN
ncbi:hypothetical protein KAU39_06580 [bacterium]|nr:hypothetical protein [bacterium]